VGGFEGGFCVVSVCVPFVKGWWLGGGGGSWSRGGGRGGVVFGWVGWWRGLWRSRLCCAQFIWCDRFNCVVLWMWKYVGGVSDLSVVGVGELGAGVYKICCGIFGIGMLHGLGFFVGCSVCDGVLSWGWYGVLGVGVGDGWGGLLCGGWGGG